MTLSRRDLEEGRMRALYIAAVDPMLALTDEQLAESLRQTLSRRPPEAGWWVFAYGSLLWNPLFPFAEARPALTFVVEREHAQYAGQLSNAEAISVLASAQGALGSSADYLERTRVALVTHGIVDPYLERLAARVAAQRRLRPMEGV